MAVIIVMVKILITTIQVNLLGGGHTNSPELLLLKFLPLNYYHSDFLATIFDFTFFHLSILGLHTFFTAWLFMYRLF